MIFTGSLNVSEDKYPPPFIYGPRSGWRVHVMAVSEERGIHTTDHNITQLYSHKLRSSLHDVMAIGIIFQERET